MRIAGWVILTFGCAPNGKEEPSLRPFVAVTFNTGTTLGLAHDDGPDDGYTADHAARSDAWYGDGLAWLGAVDATTAFFADLRPQVVGFQEIFWSEACAEIPVEDHEDFVCEQWSPGDPTVAQAVLGLGWQVACHPGKPDKCLAVREDFGRFQGCEADFCLEGLDGFPVEGCGSGARVARGVVQRADGTELTVVNVHGSSGLAVDDQACRVAQVDQVFVDLGDGEPGANGAVNLVLGDFNTDPGRWTQVDTSAARWAEFVGGDLTFAFLTQVGEQAQGSYQGVADIDHMVSDGLTGDCWMAGVTDDTPPVLDTVYFDHHPVVCTLQ